MRLFEILFVTIICVYSFTSHASTEASNIELITENIMKVCDKPENAGSYWDIKVKGDGEADIKLKLANIGLTGEVGFSKTEWDGIQKTVEDNKNYRDCVKILSPIFIDKFNSLITNKETKKTPKRKTLGGIKWQEFGAGIKITMSSCYRRSSSIICEFIAKSTESDSSLSIYESSAIYDQEGNKYIPSQVSIANFTKIFNNKYKVERLDGELVKDVETKVTAKFTNVIDSSVLVSKAMLKSHVAQNGSKGKQQTFSFRNIKILIN